MLWLFLKKFLRSAESPVETDYHRHRFFGCHWKPKPWCTRHSRFQGRRLQLQEEPVLKEVAVQESGMTVPDVYLFFVRLSRKIYYFSRVGGDRE